MEEELLIALAALDNAIWRVARPIYGLGVDRFPSGDAPSAAMPATAPRTSPEEAEATPAHVLEEALNTVEGAGTLRSVSIQGRAFVIATE
jgi:multidrug efflux pump subunit AcrB